MSKKPNIILILFPVLIMSLVAFLFYSWWRSAKEAAYLSCLASIGSETWKLDAARNLASEHETWKILNDAEVGFLLSQVKGYDCGGVDNQSLDLWNNEINIALRKPTNRLGIIIWSNGADEVSGTDDDLVAPYGEKVPKQ